MAEIEAVITADTGQFDSAMSSSGQKVDELGSKGTAAGANFGAASAVMAGGAVGIAAGIGTAIGAASDFQASMNETGAVSGATAEQMAQLSDMALQVGMQTSFSAQEGATALGELAKAGIPIPDILNGAAMSTASLAAAAGVDMPRAAEIMSAAMNTFGIAGSESARVADVLAAGANTSGASIDDLALGMAQAGASAAAMGIPLEDTVATLALFADHGLSGSDAGTSFKTMLASLTPATKAARQAFTDLGLSTADTANTMFDSQGNFVGMESAAGQLHDSLDGLTQQQRLQYLETIFGSDASRAAIMLYGNEEAAIDGTGQSLGDYIDNVQASGQATDVANAKMAGASGAMEALSGSVETAQIAFGMAFLPAVELVADKLTDLVNMFLALDPQMQTTISVVAAGAAGFLAVGSAVGFIIGPLGAMVGALAPVAAGVLAISGPLLLVVAGIAALKLAYDTNFLGFADGINAAIPIILANFQNLITLFQGVITAFQSGGLPAAIGVIASAFTTAWTNIQTAISSIDWTAVSTALLTAIQGMSDGIFTTFDGIDWAAVGASLLAGVQTAVGLVIGLDTFLLQKGIDLLQGLLDGITKKWPEIDTWLLGLGQDAADTVGVLGETLLAHGTELLTGLQAGITDFWDGTVQPWLVSLPTLITDVLSSLGTGLFDKGAEILGLLSDGVVDVWNHVMGPWVQSLPTLITDALGDLGTGLFDKGAEIMNLLWDGLKSVWDQITGWVGGLSIPWPEFSAPSIPNPLDNLPGGGGGGDAPPAKAAGGPVASGMSYWVGERGPEIFTPSRSGSIIPNGAAMGGAGGGLSLTIQTLNLPGVQDAEAFVDAMRDLMQSSAVATGRGVS